MKNEQSTSLYSVYLSRAKVSSMFSVCCLLPLLSAWAIYDRLCRLCKGSRGMERGGAQAHSKWLTASAMRVSLRLCRWGGSIPFTLVSDYTQVSSPSYAVSPSPNCRSLFWQIIGTARILGGLEGEKLTAEGLIASAVHVSLWDCVEGVVSISSTLVSDYTQISSLSYGVSPSSLICTSLFWQVMGTALGGERLTAEWLTASAVHDMLPYEIV